MFKKFLALSLVSLAAVSTAGWALAEENTDPAQMQTQNDTTTTDDTTPKGAPQTGLGGVSKNK